MVKGKKIEKETKTGKTERKSSLVIEFVLHESRPLISLNSFSYG